MRGHGRLYPWRTLRRRRLKRDCCDRLHGLDRHRRHRLHNRWRGHRPGLDRRTVWPVGCPRLNRLHDPSVHGHGTRVEAAARLERYERLSRLHVCKRRDVDRPGTCHVVDDDEHLLLFALHRLHSCSQWLEVKCLASRKSVAHERRSVLLVVCREQPERHPTVHRHE